MRDCSWQLDEILEAVAGRRPENWEGGSHFAAVFTDTRQAVEGGLFVPLVGESFDGHQFAEKALQAGAAAVLWAKEEIPEALKGRALPVGDTLQAYQALASFHCRQLGIPVVAITGSVGKTTTKDLVRTLLSSRFCVQATPVNHNNDVGVANTLIQLRPQHQVAVIEMGMRGEGQIRRLARLFDAKVGIITAIGESHLELLGTREAIARAKGELFEEMGADSLAVYPADSPYAPILRERIRGRACPFSLKADSSSAWRLLSCTPEMSAQGLGSHVRLAYPKGEVELAFSRPEAHNASNLLAALAACYELGLSPEDVAEQVASFRPTGMRSELIALGRGVTLINDAYNAAPSSVNGALELLEQVSSYRGQDRLSQARRRVAVLGDMLELGENSPEFHRQIGEACVRHGVELLLCVGKLSTEYMAPAAHSGGIEVHSVPDSHAAWPLLGEVINDDDVVLIKASHSIGLEWLAEQITDKLGSAEGGAPAQA